jgi:DNA-binding beta-propeller fold protein YncE
MCLRLNKSLMSHDDISYDPKTQKIYASIPGGPGSIRSSDPTTGDIGPPIPVGNELLKLAISDNGQFLYVGLTERLPFSEWISQRREQGLSLL